MSPTWLFCLVCHCFMCYEFMLFRLYSSFIRLFHQNDLKKIAMILIQCVYKIQVPVFYVRMVCDGMRRPFAQIIDGKEWLGRRFKGLMALLTMKWKLVFSSSIFSLTLPLLFGCVLAVFDKCSNSSSVYPTSNSLNRITVLH